MPKKPSTKYDNFWSNMWIKSGYTSKEISDKLGVSASAVRNWLSGRFLPSKESVEAMCKLFDVDPVIGMAEFDKAYKSYRNISVAEAEPIAVATPSPAPMNPVAQSNNSNFDEVLRLLYKKVDYDTFVQIVGILRG